MADHRGHEGATRAVARGGHGELRRRSRGRRGGPRRLRSAGRARRNRRRLRRPSCRARSRRRGSGRRGVGASRSRHQRQRGLDVRLRTGRHGGRRRRRHPRRRSAPAAHLPPAAADSGVHGTALGGGRSDQPAAHGVVGHAGPAHPSADAGDDAGDPGTQGACDRPGCRGRIRRQAASDAGGGDHPSRRETARQARQVHRVPQRVDARGTPWPRPDPEADARRPPGRCRHRSEGRAPRRYGRLPTAGHLRHTDPGRVHVQRDLQVPVVSLHVHQRLHEQGAHRRLPRRRASGGHLRHRADDGRTRRRAIARPARAARPELDHP